MDKTQRAFKEIGLRGYLPYVTPTHIVGVIKLEGEGSTNLKVMITNKKTRKHYCITLWKSITGEQLEEFCN